MPSLFENDQVVIVNEMFECLQYISSMFFPNNYHPLKKDVALHFTYPSLGDSGSSRDVVFTLHPYNLPLEKDERFLDTGSLYPFTSNVLVGFDN